MEFLFLIQNISLEIIIFISSILLLVILLIRYLYHEAHSVVHALTPTQINRSSLIQTPQMATTYTGDEPIGITPDVIDKDSLLSSEDMNIITPMEVTEKVDTSQVEKLV
jgi:hypothetical protein